MWSRDLTLHPATQLAYLETPTRTLIGNKARSVFSCFQIRFRLLRLRSPTRSLHKSAKTPIAFDRRLKRNDRTQSSTLA